MNKELNVAELPAQKLLTANVIRPTLLVNGWKLYVSDIAMEQLSPFNDIAYHVATGTIWCRSSVSLQDIFPTLNMLGYHHSATSAFN